MWHTPMPQILWECPHCFSIHTHLLYIRSVWDNSLFFPNCKIHIAQQQFCLQAHSRGEFDEQWDKFLRISYSNCVWLLRQLLKPASSKSRSCYCFFFLCRGHLAQWTTSLVVCASQTLKFILQLLILWCVVLLHEMSSDGFYRDEKKWFTLWRNGETHIARQDLIIPWKTENSQLRSTFYLSGHRFTLSILSLI